MLEDRSEDPDKNDPILLTPSQRFARMGPILVLVGCVLAVASGIFYKEADFSYIDSENITRERISGDIEKISAENDRMLATITDLSANLSQMKLITEKISDVKMRSYFSNIAFDAANDVRSLQTSASTIRFELSKLTQQPHAWNGLFISSARADTPATIIAQDPIVSLAIFSVTVAFVGAFILYLFTKDKKKMEFSETIIKTILGFYIGLVTGKIAK